MGADCSTVSKNGGSDTARTGTARVSFSSLKHKSAVILKPGTDYIQGYKIGGKVGPDDLLSNVVNRENDVEYVARAFEKREMPLQDMNGVREHLAVLSGLDHQHISRFVEAFDNNERLQLIYEKARPQSIFEEEKALRNGKALNEEATQVYCRQICSALSVSHKLGLVHGRLCDSSLLVDSAADFSEEDEDRSVKICDMGQTFILRPVRPLGPRTAWGAPECLEEELQAPKSYTHFKSNLKAYQSVDMWALGILLYRMLTGRFPFAGSTPPQQKQAIVESVAQFGEEWNSMPNAREVVHGLLKHSWRIRLSAEKVLRHPWILLSKTRVSRSKMMRVLQNVLFNTQENTFKKFAMRVIAEDMAPEKLEIVQKAFRLIDRNGDGSLEVKEIRQVLRKYGEEEAMADEIFEAIDRDASGNLNLAEFTAVSIGPQEYCDRETLWHCFNRFDRDSSGHFDKDEILRVAKEVEYTTEGAALEKEIEEIARDVEMPMDFDGFVHAMITPAGQSVNHFKCGLDRFCNSVCKVDTHGVRHITPKVYMTGKANPLMKPVYTHKVQAQSFASFSEGSSPRSPNVKAARKR